MTDHTEQEMREKIRIALDNAILDWDKPRQLTTINAESNYIKLVPLILSLVKSAQVEAYKKGYIDGGIAHIYTASQRGQFHD